MSHSFSTYNSTTINTHSNIVNASAFASASDALHFTTAAMPSSTITIATHSEMTVENVSANGWDGDAELVDDYSKTMELIQELLADDCVFHPTAQNYLMIAAFSIIFCLSVIGNSVVVIVILQQRSMRSVTNIYLLNLALSDLLLSVVCMPPTLVSSLVYCWVFGDLLCKLLAYLQPVVVTASAYTLAAIALERYYAICKPLHSRVWHTRSHAMLVIGFVWLISIVANVFMLFMYELRTYNRNGLNCAPKYDAVVHFAYQIYMTLVLLVVPLVVMTGLYGSVIRSLRSGIKMDIAAIEIATTMPGETNGLLKQRMSESNNKLTCDYGSDGEKTTATKTSMSNSNGEMVDTAVRNGIFPKCSTNNTSDFQRRQNKRASWSSMISMRRRNFQQQLAHQYLWTNGNSHQQRQQLNNNTTTVQFHDSNNNTKRAGFGDTVVPSPLSPRFKNGGTINAAAAAAAEAARSVRSTHSGRTAQVKQRLIRMLIVIVIIFFCCWTPSYIWWLLLNAQDSFGTFNVWNSELNTLITVLTYLSSCTNPITYCFLNSKFRNALFLSFGCRRRFRHHHHHHRNHVGSGGGCCEMTTPKYGGGTTTMIQQHAHGNGTTRFAAAIGKTHAAGTKAHHHFCQHKEELVDDNNTLTENNSTTTGCHLCYADTHAPINHCDSGAAARMLNAGGGRLMLRRVSSDFSGRSPGPADGRAFFSALGDDSASGKWPRSSDGADDATATNTPNDSTRSLALTFNVLSRLMSIFDFHGHRNAAKRLLEKRSEGVVVGESKTVLQTPLTSKKSSWDQTGQQRTPANAISAALIPPLATSDTVDSIVVQPPSGALPAPPKPPRSSPDKSSSSTSTSEYRSAATSSASLKNTPDYQPTQPPPPIIRHQSSVGRSTSGTTVHIEFPKNYSAELSSSLKPERANSYSFTTSSSSSILSSERSSNRSMRFQDAVQEVRRYSAADGDDLTKQSKVATAVNCNSDCRGVGYHTIEHLSNI